MSKNFGAAVRGEGLQGAAEGTSSAPRLAHDWPRRSTGETNVREPLKPDRTGEKTVPSRELQVKGKTKERTRERKSGKKNGRLVGAAETSKERAEWRRLQWKNLSILGLPKRREWPQCHKDSSWQVRQTRLCLKEKCLLSRSSNFK